jgi:hypothetical protein
MHSKTNSQRNLSPSLFRRCLDLRIIFWVRLSLPWSASLRRGDIFDTLQSILSSSALCSGFIRIV